MRGVETSRDTQEWKTVFTFRLEGTEGILEPELWRRGTCPESQKTLMGKKYPHSSPLPSSNLLLLLPTDINQPESRG